MLLAQLNSQVVMRQVFLPGNQQMKWKEMVEALGQVAVVGSLIIVALEVRQNTDAVRSSLLQAVSQQAYGGTVLPIENAELRAAVLADRSGGDLNEDQEYLLILYYTAMMRVQQNRFLQAQLGILDEDILFGLGGTGGMYRLPAFARFWAERSDQYPEDFREFVERELLPSIQDPSPPRP